MKNHIPLSKTFFRLFGLVFLFFLVDGRASAQALICTDFIQTSLDFECKDTVKADEVLEGSYCCYDNYVVEIDKSPGGTDCDGIWDFNVVYGSDIGMTYCVRVSDPFTGNLCYSYIYIVDNTPPTITCPVNQARNTDPGLCKHATIGGEFDPASFQDNCPDNLNTSYMLSGSTTGTGPSTLNGVLINRGITTIKWKVTDPAGNSATCTFSVTISDMEPPTITCPGDQPRNTDPGQCDYTTVGVEFDPLAFGDNCGGTSLNYGLTGAVTWNGPGSLSGFVFPPGQTTVTWVVGDGSNFNATCTFLITISAQAPSVTCPGSQSRNTKLNQCQYSTLGSEFDPLVSNGCGSTSQAFTLSGATTGNGTTTLANTIFQKGQTIVTWTATDASNSTATCSFVVTVVDNQAPTISCPGAQSRNVNTGVCTYTAVGGEFNPTASGDNCPGTNLAYVLSGATTGNGTITLAGKVFQKGTTNVMWTVTDAANLTQTCSFTITVSDAQPPSITCPGAQTRNTNSGVCTYTTAGAEFNPSAFNDNCPGASIAYVLSGATTGSGTTTLAGVVLNKGVTMVNWTATDAVNLTAVCAFNVTVNDGQAPMITCPGPQTRKTDPNLCTYTAVGAEFNPVSVSSDNCPGTVSLAYTLTGATTGTGATTLAGKVFQKGQTTIVWTATDASGNPATCSFILTVDDLQPPTITCPGALTRNTNPTQCTYSAMGTEFNATAFSDNCPGTSISYLLLGATTGNGATTLAGKVFNKGLTTVIWKATDASSNTSTCSFIVDVKDAEAPALSCPFNQLRNANAGACTYTAVGAEFNPAAFADNCPGVSIAYVLTGVTTGSGPTTLAGKVFNKGLTTVKWTATDASTNTVSCTFTVDVKDNQGPAVLCSFDQTRNTNLNLCSYAAVAAEFNPVAYGDNCPGTVGIAYTLTGVTTGTGTTTLAGKVFNKGITTVKWTATDASSNTSSCTFNVDVKDAQPPKFTSCPPVALYNINMTPGCTITIPNLVNLANANATDNCPGLTKTQAPLAGTVMTVVHNQNVSVVITAKDAAGNTATCNRIVKAKDVTAPVITTCPPNRTVSLSYDCKITVPDMRAELVASDCSGPLTVTQSPAQNALLPSDAGDVFNVVMTVTDAAGNAKTCTVVLTAEFRYFAYIPVWNTVKAINTNSNSVVATINCPGAGGEPFYKGVCVSPDGSRVYAIRAVYGSSHLAVIDAHSNTLITNIQLGWNPDGVCVTPDGSKVYVTGEDIVWVIDAGSNVVIKTIFMSQAYLIHGICASPSQPIVYASNQGKIRIINTISNTLTGTFTIPNFSIGKGVCISPDGSKLYVAGNPSKVVVINTSNNSIITTVGVGVGPEGICVSPDGSKLYVANFVPDNISVINTGTYQVDATISLPTGSDPFGVSITPDGKSVYVSNYGTNNVSVINTVSNSVVATVNTGSTYSYGNFIGGPLCLYGNNQPPPPGPDEATPAGEEPISTERALLSPELRAMPNPFTDELTIAFALEAPARAQVVLVDMTGRFVFLEKDNALDAGPQSLVWNTEDLPEGAYLVGLKVEGKAWTYRKVILIR